MADVIDLGQFLSQTNGPERGGPYLGDLGWYSGYGAGPSALSASMLGLAPLASTGSMYDGRLPYEEPVPRPYAQAQQEDQQGSWWRDAMELLGAGIDASLATWTGANEFDRAASQLDAANAALRLFGQRGQAATSETRQVSDMMRDYSRQQDPQDYDLISRAFPAIGQEMRDMRRAMAYAAPQTLANIGLGTANVLGANYETDLEGAKNYKYEGSGAGRFVGEMADDIALLLGTAGAGNALLQGTKWGATSLAEGGAVARAASRLPWLANATRGNVAAFGAAGGIGSAAQNIAPLGNDQIGFGEFAGQLATDALTGGLSFGTIGGSRLTNFLGDVGLNTAGAAASGLPGLVSGRLSAEEYAKQVAVGAGMGAAFAGISAVTPPGAAPGTARPQGDGPAKAPVDMTSDLGADYAVMLHERLLGYSTGNVDAMQANIADIRNGNITPVSTLRYDPQTGQVTSVSDNLLSNPEAIGTGVRGDAVIEGAADLERQAYASYLANNYDPAQVAIALKLNVDESTGLSPDVIKQKVENEVLLQAANGGGIAGAERMLRAAGLPTPLEIKAGLAQPPVRAGDVQQGALPSAPAQPDVPALPEAAPATVPMFGPTATQGAPTINMIPPQRRLMLSPEDMRQPAAILARAEQEAANVAYAAPSRDAGGNIILKDGDAPIQGVDPDGRPVVVVRAQDISTAPPPSVLPKKTAPNAGEARIALNRMYADEGPASVAGPVTLVKDPSTSTLHVVDGMKTVRRAQGEAPDPNKVIVREDGVIRSIDRQDYNPSTQQLIGDGRDNYVIANMFSASPKRAIARRLEMNPGRFDQGAPLAAEAGLSADLTAPGSTTPIPDLTPAQTGKATELVGFLNDMLQEAKERTRAVSEKAERTATGASKKTKDITKQDWFQGSVALLTGQPAPVGMANNSRIAKFLAAKEGTSVPKLKARVDAEGSVDILDGIVRLEKQGDKYVASLNYPIDVLDRVATIKQGADMSVRPAPTSAPILNIGLDIPGGGRLTPEEVAARIAEAGINIRSSVVHSSDTEPTFIATIDRPLSKMEADQLSADLRQEAIVQRMPDGTGASYGPQADNWGPYNPEYFVMPDGRRASELPADKDPVTSDAPEIPERVDAEDSAQALLDDARDPMAASLEEMDLTHNSSAAGLDLRAEEFVASTIDPTKEASAEDLYLNIDYDDEISIEYVGQGTSGESAAVKLFKTKGREIAKLAGVDPDVVYAFYARMMGDSRWDAIASELDVEVDPVQAKLFEAKFQDGSLYRDAARQHRAIMDIPERYPNMDPGKTLDRLSNGKSDIRLLDKYVGKIADASGLEEERVIAALAAKIKGKDASPESLADLESIRGVVGQADLDKYAAKFSRVTGYTERSRLTQKALLDPDSTQGRSRLGVGNWTGGDMFKLLAPQIGFTGAGLYLQYADDDDTFFGIPVRVLRDYLGEDSGLLIASAGFGAPLRGAMKSAGRGTLMGMRERAKSWMTERVFNKFRPTSLAKELRSSDLLVPPDQLKGKKKAEYDALAEAARTAALDNGLGPTTPNGSGPNPKYSPDAEQKYIRDFIERHVDARVGVGVLNKVTDLVGLASVNKYVADTIDRARTMLDEELRLFIDKPKQVLEDAQGAVSKSKYSRELGVAIKDYDWYFSELHNKHHKPGEALDEARYRFEYDELKSRLENQHFGDGSSIPAEDRAGVKQLFDRWQSAMDTMRERHYQTLIAQRMGQPAWYLDGFRKDLDGKIYAAEAMIGSLKHVREEAELGLAGAREGGDKDAVAGARKRLRETDKQIETISKELEELKSKAGAIDDIPNQVAASKARYYIMRPRQAGDYVLRAVAKDVGVDIRLEFDSSAKRDAARRDLAIDILTRRGRGDGVEKLTDSELFSLVFDDKTRLEASYRPAKKFKAGHPIHRMIDDVLSNSSAFVNGAEYRRAYEGVRVADLMDYLDQTVDDKIDKESLRDVLNRYVTESRDGDAYVASVDISGLRDLFHRVIDPTIPSLAHRKNVAGYFDDNWDAGDVRRFLDESLNWMVNETKVRNARLHIRPVIGDMISDLRKHRVDNGLTDWLINYQGDASGATEMFDPSIMDLAYKVKNFASASVMAANTTASVSNWMFGYANNLLKAAETGSQRYGFMPVAKDGTPTGEPKFYKTIKEARAARAIAESTNPGVKYADVEGAGAPSVTGVVRNMVTAAVPAGGRAMFALKAKQSPMWAAIYERAKDLDMAQAVAAADLTGSDIHTSSRFAAGARKAASIMHRMVEYNNNWMAAYLGMAERVRQLGLTDADFSAIGRGQIEPLIADVIDFGRSVRDGVAMGAEKYADKTNIEAFLSDVSQAGLKNRRYTQGGFEPMDRTSLENSMRKNPLGVVAGTLMSAAWRSSALWIGTARSVFRGNDASLAKVAGLMLGAGALGALGGVNSVPFVADIWNTVIAPIIESESNGESMRYDKKVAAQIVEEKFGDFFDSIGISREKGQQLGRIVMNGAFREVGTLSIGGEGGILGTMQFPGVSIAMGHVKNAGKMGEDIGRWWSGEIDFGQALYANAGILGTAGKRMYQSGYQTASGMKLDKDGNPVVDMGGRLVPYSLATAGREAFVGRPWEEVRSAVIRREGGIPVYTENDKVNFVKSLTSAPGVKFADGKGGEQFLLSSMTDRAPAIQRSMTVAMEKHWPAIDAAKKQLGDMLSQDVRIGDKVMKMRELVAIAAQGSKAVDGTSTTYDKYITSLTRKAEDYYAVQAMAEAIRQQAPEAYNYMYITDDVMKNSQNGFEYMMRKLLKDFSSDYNNTQSFDQGYQYFQNKR